MTGVKKKLVYSAVIAVLLLGSVSAYLAYLILWNADFYAFKLHPASYVVDRVRATEKLGGTLEFGEADINGVLELYLKKIPLHKDLTVTGMYARMSESKISFYMPVKYKGWGLLLYSEGQLLAEKDTLVYVPAKFKLGKLTLPVDFVLKRLSAYSNEDFVVKHYKSIHISKDVLPFNVNSLSIDRGKIVATIQKAQTEQPAPGQSPTPENSNPTGGQANQEGLLQRASRQLGGVLADVKTSKEKEIIRKIQSVVGKMIQDPSYPYQAEADTVKAQYSSLSQEEKSDIKDAILNNMDTGTLKEIKAKFGL